MEKGPFGVCGIRRQSRPQSSVLLLMGVVKDWRGSILLVGRRRVGKVQQLTLQKGRLLTCMLFATHNSNNPVRVCSGISTSLSGLSKPTDWLLASTPGNNSLFFLFSFSLYNTFSFFKTLLEGSFINVILQLLTTS